MNDFKMAYKDKLKGKLFGLLREREKQGEWEPFLEAIEVEMIGLEDALASIDYYTLRAKIHSLRFLKYSYFRKTIFDCMNLIESVYERFDD